ncbi:MAG: dihydrofolate reductase family protein [Pseudonocardiaceae bacterium]
MDSRLKDADGRDLVLFAGVDVARSLVFQDLLDEYRLVSNPIVLGGGTLAALRHDEGRASNWSGS